MNVMITSPRQAVDPTLDFLHVSHALIVMEFSATMTSANHSGPKADLCIFGGFVISKNNPAAYENHSADCMSIHRWGGCQYRSALFLFGHFSIA